MKIAHINGVYRTGSTGRLISDLVEYGKKSGHESRVFYSEGKENAPEAKRYITNYERNLHAVLSRVSGLQGYWSKIATRRLIGELQHFRPDVVHLHVVHGNCLNLPLLFDWLIRLKVGVVVTLHDCWWFTGRCAHPLYYSCDHYQSHCVDCPAKRDVCPSWLFDRAEKMRKDKEMWLCSLPRLKVVAVSHWGVKVANESFLGKKSVACIYNWVDTETFYPTKHDALRQEMKLTGEKVILGVASRWNDQKGLGDLIWLAEQLPKCTVVIVGEMDQNVRLPANMILVPSTDDKKKLAQLYCMADVFVNPSRMETFGLTTVEAMACGTAAIVYDVTACPELIGPDTGLVVPAQAGVEGLLKATQELLNNPADSELCVRWVRENFSFNVGAKQYYQIYSDI